MMGQQTILRTEQQLSCWTSSVTALSGVDFGHHDHRTSPHLTSFRGYLKKNVFIICSCYAMYTIHFAHLKNEKE
jgi:hypothetical protein